MLSLKRIEKSNIYLRMFFKRVFSAKQKDIKTEM